MSERGPAPRRTCRWARCSHWAAISTVPYMTRSKRFAIGIVAASIAGGVVVTSGPAASAPGAQVSRGDFRPFAAGASLDIDGHAQMVRDRSGTTLVRIHVEGLTPGGSYASHVHKQACELGDA